MNYRFSSVCKVIAGNLLYALTVVLFLEPSGLLTGGTTGIAFVVQKSTGMPIWLFVLFFDVAMLILGWIFLGKAFAMTTILSTFVYPLFLHLFENLLAGVVLTKDPVLCALFTGLGIGCALGIVIREGASTGGMDIPPLILHKLFRWSVSGMMSFFDIAIILMGALYYTSEAVLWGIVTALIYTAVLDRMLMIGASRTEIKVVSDKSNEIRKAILSRIDRGVTLLEAKGGYSLTDTEIVLSVLANRELPSVEKIIHEIDPAAFLIVTRISEVRGRGFTMQKRYAEQKNA